MNHVSFVRTSQKIEKMHYNTPCPWGTYFRMYVRSWKGREGALAVGEGEEGEGDLLLGCVFVSKEV